MDIHILFALVICFAAVMYTIFDGFDLGVGILFPFIKNESSRDTMVDSITPVWDGNETWLILLGVGLFGGFPKAYSILLPALYLPLIVMVIGLILRGVAMEFRFVSVHRKSWWDAAFSFGSVMAVFCQGLVLGNLMEGIKVYKDIAYRDITFNFLSPFTILIGLVLIVTYALIGATWLNFKTSGKLQATFKRFVKRIIFCLLLLLILVVFGRFYLEIFIPRFGAFGIGRILSLPSIVWYIATVILTAAIYFTVDRKNDILPFVLNILMTTGSALYIVSGFWPYIVPPDLTIFDAGSPAYGNRILLICSLVIVPIILAYFIYSYIVFKGKVSGKDNYEPSLAESELLKSKVKVNGNDHAGFKVLTMAWPWRIAISLGGIFFFFVVLGFFGDLTAQLAIAVFIVIFLAACFKYQRI